MLRSAPPLRQNPGAFQTDQHLFAMYRTLASAQLLSRAAVRAQRGASSRPALRSLATHSGQHSQPRRSDTRPHAALSRALVLGTASSTALVSWGATARPLHADASSSSSSAVVSAVTETGGFDPIPKEKMAITLYQYAVCPFCNKVRAYFDYHNIPYNVVEVDPMGKKELVQFSKDYRKVPIAVINGNQVNGSGDIIAAVHRSILGSIDADKLAAADAASGSGDEDWIKWVDDHLIHLISPNIYKTPTESMQAFEYIADNAKFSAWQRFTIRYTGAAAMYMVGKKIAKRYNIVDARAEMYEAINKWTDAVEKRGGAFLGGTDKPGTADLAVYGVMRSIMTFDTFADIKKNCLAFEPWFERTRAAVGEPSIVDSL
jgi:microsomal prostaglandin-E synthase 2